MGLPDDWQRVESWLLNKEWPRPGKSVAIPIVKKKNPEIPTLDSYTKNPGPEFWNVFPFKDLPDKAETKVDGLELKKKVEKEKEKLTYAQVVRGYKTTESILNGADCAQKFELPPCMQANAKSAEIYGEAVTDTIATWVKEGFVAGPFDTPPLPKFRVNCLMALPQETKIRPVLNGSLPENNSLNSTVNDKKVEKVKMCSARCYSYSVIDAGKSCYIAKMDMVNAYKNVPCTPTEYRLQGIHWLGKFFVETRQIFGAKTAVCNYDILGNTLLNLTLVNCKIENSLVHRQLDDVPIAVPEHKKEWCEEFVKEYKKCCEDVGIELAADDPKMEKAFSISQEGKVLGILFKTQNLEWAYPEDKKRRTLQGIEEFLSGEPVDLLMLQKLMGRINDVSLMAPFMKMFKNNLNGMLGWLQRNPQKKCHPDEQAKKDIIVWAGFLKDEHIWVPIAHRPISMPLSHFKFTSDAAGMNGVEKNNEQVGVGVIGFDMHGEILLAHQMFWPQDLGMKRDKKGASFASKTVMLETVGLLIPFLLVPEKISCSHVQLEVDNIGCYYGWENQSVAGDKHASILIRAIAIISAYLKIRVHVKHLPRMSSWEACLCDRLSREKSTTTHDKRLLRNYEEKILPKELREWLKNPEEDWELPYKLLKTVKEKINGM